MKDSRCYFFILCVNFVATVFAYYKKCYGEFSVCLTTNTPLHSESNYRLYLSSAENWCKNHSSSLTAITNETVQAAIEEFISDSSARLYSDVITNGYRFNQSAWRWNDDSISDIYPKFNADYYYYRYAYLQVSTDRTVASFDREATSTRKFICSHIRNYSICSHDHRQLGRRCYKIHEEEVTWFSARSICLKEEGSDLAIFEDDIPSLTLEWRRNEEFWIGLRNEIWSWMNNLRYYGEIKYSNWDDGKPSIDGGNCLCLQARTGKWTNCNCSQKYRYICVQEYASGSTSTAAETTVSSTLTTPQSTTQIMDVNFSGKASGKPLDMEVPPNSGMLLGLGIGSLCLLILIVVIAVVVFNKNRRSRSGDVGPRHGNSPPPTAYNDDAPTTVYAVVMPNANEPVRSPSEKTSNQTVYAELDLEPKRKIAHRTSEPVQGPLEKASNQVVYADVGLAPKGNTGPTHERAVPESEYAKSSLVDSVYANSAQTKA